MSEKKDVLSNKAKIENRQTKSTLSEIKLLIKQHFGSSSDDAHSVSTVDSKPLSLWESRLPQYKFLKILSESVDVKVYKAQLGDKGEFVAIKEYFTSVPEEFEARMQKTIHRFTPRSGFICSYKGYELTKSSIFVITELCDGTLKDKFKPTSDIIGGDLHEKIFDEHRILRWMYQLTSALEEIHAEKIDHSNLDLDSILLLNDDIKISIDYLFQATCGQKSDIFMIAKTFWHLLAELSETQKMYKITDLKDRCSQSMYNLLKFCFSWTEGKTITVRDMKNEFKTLLAQRKQKVTLIVNVWKESKLLETPLLLENLCLTMSIKEVKEAVYIQLKQTTMKDYLIQALIINDKELPDDALLACYYSGPARVSIHCVLPQVPKTMMVASEFKDKLFTGKRHSEFVINYQFPADPFYICWHPHGFLVTQPHKILFHVFSMESTEESKKAVLKRYIYSYGAPEDSDFKSKVNWARGATIHDNQIYVVDSLNYRILVFEVPAKKPRDKYRTLQLLKTINLEQNGIVECIQFYDDATLVFSMRQPNSLALFSLKKEKITKRVLCDSIPRGFTIVKNRIYVCQGFQDIGSHNIAIYSKKKFKKIKCFGNTGSHTKGSHTGQFNSPCDIVHYNKILYITDSFNHQIQVWTIKGDYLMSWKIDESTEAASAIPMGITLDPDKHLLYVVDTQNKRVITFESDSVETIKKECHDPDQVSQSSLLNIQCTPSVASD